MTDAASNPAQPKLRSPNVVMRLSRLGAFHQSRLSFMRILLRRLKHENWSFSTHLWDIDRQGVGTAVITAQGPARTYSLVAFSHDLPDHMRSDRVIATAWDATFTLFDGIPTPEDIARLKDNVPLQEEGRISRKELSLSRANRSVRLWSYVVNTLAAGRQPDRDKIEATGYLMRTTAVYGSGKFGAADREDLAERPEFSAPFQVEMLNVYLIRTFVIQLVEHMARAMGDDNAVTLSSDLKRIIGIGNSTGLGMAPFLVNHPALLHAWINAKETALSRVLALEMATTAEQKTFTELAVGALENAQQWQTDSPLYVANIEQLRSDLTKLLRHVRGGALTEKHPWQSLHDWSEHHLEVEAQEQLNSLMLEPYGPLVDDLAEAMACDESLSFRIDGTATLDDTRSQIEQNFAWCLSEDFQCKQGNARFWYVSEAKLEPRLGERHEEPGGELEFPLAVARDIKKYYDALAKYPATNIAEFLLIHPEHRNAARRVQLLNRLPYSEIRDNLINADMLPVDMLRCKLSFFGAAKFDPRSDRWLRICMYQNAPLPEELSTSSDFWSYPGQS